MHYIFWEFQVHPDKIAEFERRYGAQGDWAALFAGSAHYIRTTLGRDTGVPGRYLVTDVWESAESFAAFKREFHAEYERLDRECEALTLREVHIGNFEVV